MTHILPSRFGKGLSALTTALLVCACDSGGGGGSAPMELVEVSHGFGLLVPHQVFKADSNGAPTNELVAIRSVDDLVSNVTLANPVLPITEWPAQAVLPNGEAGNHYIYAQFSQPIDIESVLSSSPGAQGSFGLTGALNVVAVDPGSGLTSPVPGRAFIGGQTFAGSGSPLDLQQWVVLDDAGNAVAADVGGDLPGVGFPGVGSASFSGAATLLANTTFVFVADSDGDLSTLERFPTNRQIQLRATPSVLSVGGKGLSDRVLGGSTVGTDTLAPEVALTPAPNSVPVTVPAFGDTDVDPGTDIEVTFTESVQPLTVGPLPTNKPPTLSSAISITFGPLTSQTSVPFTALPVSIYDFSTWVLTPSFAFPGSGPVFAECGTFNTVSMNVVPGQVQDLATPAGAGAGGNLNTLPAASSFTTGEGPGLVNAPVSPDAIYAVRQGSSPGLSVIDLNGFGQSTGDPTFDGSYAKGHSNFRNNPNLIQQGTAIHPQIFPGTCTIDGGSAGVFTLTRDSSLNTLLITSPLITSAGDVMIGQPLDTVYNNAKSSSGCQAGGGNVCALNGLKLIQVSFGFAGQNTMTVPSNLPSQPIIGNANQVQGGGNPISWSPHPNPPALIFPPLCVQPYIGGQEPTSFYTLDLLPPVGQGIQLPNLLNPGDPFGDPLDGTPPSGLLTTLQNTFFEGPDRQSLPLSACLSHMMRQQVGHFLYMIDRARREIVVLNSNRFQVLDRIPVSDPTNLAMSPNLDLLAVSNQKSDLVQFIDINPNSGTFHEVVKNTTVGRGPRGIAWDPANEDILVCNEPDNSVSIISAHTLSVRKTVKSQLNLPFDVVITQRQNGFGFLRNVYFAWIINRNGDLAIFESGPSGLNGWGYDDIIGVAPMSFENPKAIAVDFSNLGGGAWIVHENQLGNDGLPTGQTGGAISNVIVAATTFGQLPLFNANLFINPQFRDMSIQIQASIGSDQLTGIPVDIAQDDQVNFGSLPNFEGLIFQNYSAGVPAAINGKSYVRLVNGIPTGSKHPRFLFAAVPNSSEGPGVVDVINLQSSNLRFDTDPYLPGKQSIPAPGVNMLIDYWRQ
ncbi:MAG TPA: beta-propeller fold lactonase family protein [Planctomycetota bacterium]|nr:beta-propeller fold lactonase family protein [Planctomycetota bacterium]